MTYGNQQSSSYQLQGEIRKFLAKTRAMKVKVKRLRDGLLGTALASSIACGFIFFMSITFAVATFIFAVFISTGFGIGYYRSAKDLEQHYQIWNDPARLGLLKNSLLETLHALVDNVAGLSGSAREAVLETGDSIASISLDARTFAHQSECLISKVGELRTAAAMRDTNNVQRISQVIRDQFR